MTKEWRCARVSGPVEDNDKQDLDEIIQKLDKLIQEKPVNQIGI